MSPSILEFGRLPVRPIDPALANELQVAVEALEATRPQGSRHLPLQRGLGVILESAHGFGHGQRNVATIIALIIRFSSVRSAARQRDAGKRSHGKCRPSAEPIDWPSDLHSLPFCDVVGSEPRRLASAFRGLHCPTKIVASLSVVVN